MNFDQTVETLTDDYFEYEQGQAEIIVKGRLRKSLSFWEGIGAYDYVLDTIRNGYKIPFFSTPPTAHLANNRSALNHESFVVQAITDLLSKGLIEECSNIPYVVNPLTVSVQNNEKKRLILDLRHVNKHLWKSKIKFEDIKVAMNFIEKDFYFFKFDLHSAYHHVDIFEQHTDFLGFSWTFGDVDRYFKFKVLPFGLSSACYIFTKLTRPLVKKWRGEGMKVLMYLDDGLGTHSDFDKCQDMALRIKQDLICSGFVPKNEKSLWIPTKTLIFLGYYIDTASSIIKIPNERLVKLEHIISELDHELNRKHKVHVKKVASFVGQVVSMFYVLGNVVYIMTKYLSIDILTAKSWYCDIKLSDHSVEQIAFWKQCFRDTTFNQRQFIVDHGCHTVVYSDASSTGYAGYEVQTPCNIAHGMWSEDEKVLSSTWRELTAVLRVLLSISRFLKNKSVKWFTDNQSVSIIAKKGSMKSHLQDIAFKIFQFCLANNIFLYIEWIPRSSNEIADYYSKVVDFDDWGVSVELFEYLDSLWGPHEVDFFASENNNKLSAFYSRFWTVSSIGVDAFTVDWFGVNGWFVPPVNLISKVLKYMYQCRAFGTLIVPVWKSASFWPILIDENQNFIHAVMSYIELPTSRRCYIPGKYTTTFGRYDLPFGMLALRMDFRNYCSDV